MDAKLSRISIFALLTALAPSVCAQDLPRNPVPGFRSVGYRIEYKATLQPSSGEPRFLFTEVRFASESGKWRTVQIHNDGRRVERFSELPNEQFLVDEKRGKLVRLSTRAPQGHSDAVGTPLSHGKRLGSEKVLDFETEITEYVIAEGATVTVWRAPALKGAILKLVRTNPKNTFILEASRVALGEPEPELLGLPNYPIEDENPPPRR